MGFSDSSLFDDRYRLYRITLCQTAVVFTAIGLLLLRGMGISAGHTGNAVGVYFAVVLVLGLASSFLLLHPLAQYLGLHQFPERSSGEIFVGTSPVVALIFLPGLLIPDSFILILPGYVVSLALGAVLSRLRTAKLS